MPKLKNKSSISKHLKVIGVMLILLLALTLLWHGNENSMQAAPAMVAGVYFDGEYRIADGEWQKIVKGNHISSTEGDVTLRGNFHMLAPDGEYVGIYTDSIPIALYTNHINLTFYEGENEPFIIDVENPLYGDSACHEDWTAYVLTTGSEDPIEIVIHNPHSFGNETAIDEMLSSTALWADIEFEKGVPVALDGKYAMFSDIPLGANIRITFSGEEIVFVDAITPEYEETVSLIYVKYEKLTDALVVTFKDPVTEEKVQYPLGDSPVITRNGSNSAITSLKANDLAVVNVVNGKIKKIDAEEAEKDVLGTVDAINFGEEFTLSINVKGNVTDYKVYDDVTIKRNGKAAEISDILVGDSVTLVTKYNVISKITATSKTKTIDGRIVEIVISADPRITVDEDGIETEYVLLNSVAIKRGGEEADVYSLRLGDTVEITLESDTVTSILVTAAETSANISGKVEYIDTSYGYIKLEGVEELIFIDDAKIQKATGESITNKGIKAGANVTIFGTKKIGTYEATLVIVN